jgi:hypothetical protein
MFFFDGSISPPEYFSLADPIFFFSEKVKNCIVQVRKKKEEMTVVQ